MARGTIYLHLMGKNPAEGQNHRAGVRLLWSSERSCTSAELQQRSRALRAEDLTSDLEDCFTVAQDRLADYFKRIKVTWI